MVSIRRAYGDGAAAVRHPLSTLTVVGLTVMLAVAAAGRGSWGATLVVGGIVILLAVRGDPAPVRVAVVVVVLAVPAVARAGAAWDAVSPRALGPFTGWTTVMSDPQRFGSATRVVLEVEGERFEWWARGRAASARATSWAVGERVRISAERHPLEPERVGRVAWQHVVGELDVEWAADVAPGRPVDRASERVRGLIAGAAEGLPGDDGALFRGLVIGDDRDQPADMLERFRASGMSHLTAVSGQNVAFVLAAAGPLLRRLRAAPRWVVTVGLIGWFVALTRFEPSILRAGAMAALSATAFALGRERAPFRMLCLAVGGLLLVDPVLVVSVGFWLSVGATAGVVTVGPFLSARLSRLGMVGAALGVTLGAQVGVVVPSLLVFGRLPLVSVPANLLAVPVAGAVMLYGLPASLLAGAVPVVAPVVMFPCRVGVRWVDTVAVLGERLEPGGAATWAGWLVLVGVVGVVTAFGSGKNRHPDGGAPPDR